MPKLNQVIAATKDGQARSESDATNVFQTLQKEALFIGRLRTYEARTDADSGGVGQPPESQKVQTTVQSEIERFVTASADIFDLTATRNYGNTRAKADVIIDGTVLLKDAPVEYLLFLEGRLKLVGTMLKEVPTLDPTFNWTLDSNDGLYHADSVQTISTKKVPRVLVKVEATDKHPAQVETYPEDIPIGTWTTIRLSGAVPAPVVASWNGRLAQLTKAVKFAREEANSLEVQPQTVGRPFLDFIFAEPRSAGGGMQMPGTSATP